MKKRRRSLPERVVFSIFMVFPTVFLWRKIDFVSDNYFNIAILIVLVFTVATIITEVFRFFLNLYHSKKGRNS